ncbi:MAG: bifunctional phosphopantothenoylcysteine decarboxylase/phosphopantothenate--cysteine ligase CoaBC [Deltaproteobacteria bacterium]|nr:bifunctional phosphopantothenoylcysteine decarboxylase/phosphopantothenate--cysteine ligase CoaBC [Deltaproteobacteria bacterium]
MGQLSGKTIVVGISGGIAIYKVCEVVRRLKVAGACVHVVMTKAAQAFVSPLTFQTLSGNTVHTDLFNLTEESHISHITLADSGDLILLAPATANTLAKANLGIADDLLSTILVATHAPLLIAPAMNVNMWNHPQTKSHLQSLKKKGATIIEPGVGDLACGWEGEGRLAEPTEILQRVFGFFGVSNQLADKKVLINAGPTREYLDPVRFISNPSSGRMGYALAEAAKSLGASVILVSGPTMLPTPAGIDTLRVENAKEMLEICKKHFPACDLFIATAAVGDYQAKNKGKNKIKKDKDALMLELVRTPDILELLSKIKKHQRMVGFAAETENMLAYAKEKLKKKNLDAIVANPISQSNPAFASHENQATLIFADGKTVKFPRQSKEQLARKILKEISNKFFR